MVSDKVMKKIMDSLIEDPLEPNETINVKVGKDFFEVKCQNSEYDPIRSESKSMSGRKVTRHGNSLAISIPSEIVKIKDLKLGDRVRISFLDMEKIED